MIEMNYIYEVQDHFINDPKDSKLMVKLHTNYNNEEIKNEIIKIARNEFLLRKVADDEVDAYVDAFEKYMWKYYLIEPLLEDKEITDINLYNENHITVLNGENHRWVTDLKFHDRKDYERFIRVTALKNEINLSNVNAQQVFVDSTSNEHFKLRIDISTDYINCSQIPYMHIRKNPKRKYQTEDLVRMKVMTQVEMDYIIDRFNNGSGMLIVGEGNSGKSTLLNALLDKANHNKKILVAQESDGELFTDYENGGHPDILFQHLIKNNGEGSIEYTLGDLIEKGLVSDFNMFVIAEVKNGRDAAMLLNAAVTAQGVATSHGKSAIDGIEKMVDYICKGSRYEYKEALKYVSTFSTIVFMKQRRLGEILSITGWDAEKQMLKMKSIKLHSSKFADYMVKEVG